MKILWICRPVTATTVYRVVNAETALDAVRSAAMIRKQRGGKHDMEYEATPVRQDEYLTSCHVSSKASYQAAEGETINSPTEAWKSIWDWDKTVKIKL